MISADPRIRYIRIEYWNYEAKGGIADIQSCYRTLNEAQMGGDSRYDNPDDQKSPYVEIIDAWTGDIWTPLPGGLIWNIESAKLISMERK